MDENITIHDVAVAIDSEKKGAKVINAIENIGAERNIKTDFKNIPFVHYIMYDISTDKWIATSATNGKKIVKLSTLKMMMAAFYLVKGDFVIGMSVNGEIVMDKIVGFDDDHSRIWGERHIIKKMLRIPSENEIKEYKNKILYKLWSDDPGVFMIAKIDKRIISNGQTFFISNGVTFTNCKEIIKSDEIWKLLL